MRTRASWGGGGWGSCGLALRVKVGRNGDETQNVTDKHILKVVGLHPVFLLITGVLSDSLHFK